MIIIKTESWLKFLRLYLLLCIGIFISGCSLIKVTEIPKPNDELLVYNKVIKDIQVRGNIHTNEDVFYHAMVSKVGDIYKKDNTRLDRRWLKQLGIFTSLLFETVEKEDGIILVVSVKEVNPYIPAPSINITDENGLELGVSLSSPNLFGIASYLSASVRGGGATNISFRFRNPEIPEANWWNGYTLEYFHMSRQNELFNFYEKSDDFMFQYLRYVTDNFSLGPKFTFLSVKSDKQDITLDEDNLDNMPALGFLVQLNTINRPHYPTDGWWSEIALMRYIGDANYWQGTIDFRRYLELGSRTNSIACYSLATVSSGTVGENIPVYMQFNIGGTNSIRGWNLGSREGKNQFLNTIEYWHILLDMKRYKFWFLQQSLGLQLALFTDAGTAWNDESEFKQNWLLGGGVGIRLIMASGVEFRVDFAFGQKDLGVSLSIGSGEKAVAQRDRVR